MSYVGKNPRFEGTILTDQVATAVTAPASGSHKIVNRNGVLYMVDSSGAETPVGNAGSGEKTYIENPSAAAAITGWTAVGDLAVERTTTAADLPREHTTGSGIKITADTDTQSTADYVYYDFNLDDVDLSKKLKIQWSQKTTGTYNAGDLAVVITTQADRTTALHTPVTTAIPAADGVFTTSFDASTTAALSLVIRATTDMTTDGGIVISDVIVGPGIQPQGAVVTEWTSYTPSWTAASVNPSIGDGAISGKWRRVGSNMELNALVTSGSTTTYGTGAYRLSIPSGYTIDSSVYINSTTSRPIGLGTGFALKLGGAGNQWFNVVVSRESDTTLGLLFTNADVSTTASVGSANPSWTASQANQQISISASIPIAEWAGSGTINVAQNDVEYASNSSSTDAADTTSFAYGPEGSAGVIGTTALSTACKKRVRFQTPIQSTDRLWIEVKSSTGIWMPITAAVYETGISPLIYQDGTAYGIGLSTAAVNATDIDVVFARYGSNANGAYAAAGEAWTSFAGFKWRLVKASGGQAVGFGAATGSASGLLPPVTSMSDVLATQLGHKQYLHGTTYNGGNAPTLSGSSWTTTRAVFIPYQLQDGTWRMRFNARGALSGLANNNSWQLSLNGVTFKNVSNWQQAFAVKVDSTTLTGFHSGYGTPNTSTLQFIYNGGSIDLNDDYSFSGDVELESKPTWAY